MNNTNPLIPQGSLLEQAPRGRSRFMVAFYCVAAIHVVFFGGLLLVGCNGDKSKTTDNTTQTGDTTTASTTDTNIGGLTASPTVTTSAPPPYVPYVAPTPPTPPPPPTPAATEYVVLKGDNLGDIAKKHGVTLKALLAANPSVVPTKMQVGTKLQIPAGGTASGGSAALTPGGGTMLSADGGETYTVKSGDTLTKIATTHGTTVKALRAANSLKTDSIKVGQKLKIPAKAAAPVVEPTPMATPPPIPMAPAAPASPAPLSPAAPVR